MLNCKQCKISRETLNGFFKTTICRAMEKEKIIYSAIVAITAPAYKSSSRINKPFNHCNGKQ